MKKQKFNDEMLLPYVKEIQVVDANLISINNNFIGEFIAGASNSKADYVFDFEFDPTLSKADKLDYQISASSGLLAALINELFVGEFSLHDSHKWGQEKVEKLILSRAKKEGYKGNDLKSAISKLEASHKMASDSRTAEFGGGRQHHLRDFSHHFSLTGLIFSLLSQFTSKTYGTDTSGSFVIFDLPNNDLIGKNFVEKIYLGTWKWLLHLLSDVAGSSGAIGKGTGIPGPILSFLKTTCTMPIFKNLKLNYNNSELDLSIYISKLYNGTHYILNEKDQKIPFDLRTEMGITNHISKSAVPVLANEVIVRSFYTIRRIIEIIDESNIKSFDDFLKLDSKSYLPISNRRLNRMLSVSSGVFFTVSTTAVVAKNAIKKPSSSALPYILININYFGMLRFVLAVKTDFRYMTKDFKDFKEYYINRQFTVYDNIDIKFVNELFTLDYEKARILEGIKYHMIRYDIISEKNNKDKILKEEWFKNWEKDYFEIKLGKDPKYILRASLDLYKAYSEELKIEKDRWLTLVYLEIESFKPYHQLDNDQKKYSKLKMVSNYMKDVFIPQQSVMTNTKVNEITKELKKSISILKGTKNKFLFGTGTVLTVGALTGGLAFSLAPQIAVILAGKSVAGLSGAALTSASLAILGGGSLATGGLGMAGGTALIVGGGSLLGASMGTISVYTTIGSLSSEYVLKELSKLLTFVKVEIVPLEDSQFYLSDIYKTILKQIDDLKILEEDTKDKKALKNIKESISYLKRFREELFRLMNKNIQEGKVILLENTL